MVVKMLMTKNSAYAAALMIAAASGSLIGTKAQAQAASAASAAALQTKPSVTLSSVAMIERKSIDANGKEIISYKSPNQVQIVPGDKVVFKLSYANLGSEPARAFRATNPMPKPIQFVSAREEWAQVSVDGGKTWGKLNELTVTETVKMPSIEGEETSADAQTKTSTRSADIADVTHVRWVFTKPIAPGEKGDVSYIGLIK